MGHPFVRTCAAGAEEVREEGAALFGEDGREDFDAVVEGGVVEDGERAAAGAGLGVGGGVEEAADARVKNGAGAHGAGLERGVEVAVEQAVVAEGAAGGAEGEDFGVGGGVLIGNDAIVGSSDDLIFKDDDGAYGDFACSLGEVGLGDGFAEVELRLALVSRGGQECLRG